MESELTISQVTKIYGNDKRALNEVSLVLTPGVYGLVGPNGAGKSTLMNILTQNLRQTSGTVRKRSGSLAQRIVPYWATCHSSRY